MSVPVEKLLGLFVKTLAKPFATRLKIEARNHKSISKLCTVTGEAVHQITSRLNVLASGYKVLGIAPLPEEQALAQGINFLSESFIFLVAGGIIVIEYTRSEYKSAKKAQKLADEDAKFKGYLESKFTELSEEVHRLNSTVSQLEETVKAQDNRIENLKNPRRKKEGDGQNSSQASNNQSSYWSWLRFY